MPLLKYEGMNISEIFASKGEEYFRYIEKQTSKIVVG